MLFTILTVSTCILSSCHNQKDEKLAEYKLLYERARYLGDDELAAYSINQLIAADTSSRFLTDTLINIYYKLGRYKPVLVLSNQEKGAHKNDLPFCLHAAIAARSVGDNKTALEYLTSSKLSTATDSLPYMYETAVNLMEIKEYVKAMAYYTEAIKISIASTEMVEVKGNKVLYSSACFNGIGICEAKQGAFDLAITAFKEALKKSPGFSSAQNNLNALQTSLSANKR